MRLPGGGEGPGDAPPVHSTAPPVRSLLLQNTQSSDPAQLFTEPAGIFRSREGRSRVEWDTGECEEIDADAFTALEMVLNRRRMVAAGWWGYELGSQVERLPVRRSGEEGLPDCWVGLYQRRIEVRIESAAAAPSGTPGPAESNFSRDAYLRAVGRIKEYIAAGDCYQVNLAQRFRAPGEFDAWNCYLALSQLNPAPFAAYLDAGDHQVVSSSPELFLRIRDRDVMTRPIKGTRPRHADPAADAAAAQELLRSAKDRAELVMIVDLERNDLGRVCEWGSVTTPAIWDLESFATVHHLVGTVRGRLRKEVSPLQCLRSCFPGGSITGAPKIRAMEIIHELEPVQRGPYTGAIGFVDGAEACWNIAIRTMVVQPGRILFHAGGGVTADSDPAAEYEETLAKASAMLRVIHP